MIALANALQCQMEHDRCRKTKHHPSAGQNLYSQSTTNRNGIDDQYIKSAVTGSTESWFDEYKLVKDFEWIRSFGGQNVPWWKIGHFTQMIWNDATAIGCAIVKSQGNIYIACNYDFGNMQGSSVYEIGRMGSKCQTGMNPKYPGLCSKSEFHTNYMNEAPPVIKWIQSGKSLDSDKNYGISNKNVEFSSKIVILIFYLVIRKILFF